MFYVKSSFFCFKIVTRSFSIFIIILLEVLGRNGLNTCSYIYTNGIMATAIMVMIQSQITEQTDSEKRLIKTMSLIHKILINMSLYCLCHLPITLGNCGHFVVIKSGSLAFFVFSHV